ncbi:MAG: AmmeMemoRadiSam system protein A [Anaerolineae bacterium]
MENEHLSEEEKRILLQLARQALEHGVHGTKLPPLDWASLPERLRAPGATFVTLTVKGALRGCVGALEPYQPLAEDVREHAIAAALEDYRFPPVRPEELNRICIEVSVLTRPQPLEYATADELLSRLRPHIDGVILQDGLRRATFLPQVWDKIPAPADFLDNLCYKMGVSPDLWRRKHLDVFIYQVEEFHEPEKVV